jgi:hypothetical protein
MDASYKDAAHHCAKGNNNSISPEAGPCQCAPGTAKANPPLPSSLYEVHFVSFTAHYHDS